MTVRGEAKGPHDLSCQVTMHSMPDPSEVAASRMAEVFHAVLTPARSPTVAYLGVSRHCYTVLSSQCGHIHTWRRRACLVPFDTVSKSILLVTTYEVQYLVFSDCVLTRDPSNSISLAPISASLPRWSRISFGTLFLAKAHQSLNP